MSEKLPGLVIDIEARINKLEQGLKRANDRQRKAAREMEATAKRSADKISKTYEGMGKRMQSVFAMPGLIRGGLGVLGGGAIALQIRQYGRLADEATRMQNALRVVGLEGADLTRVYGRLFQSAQKNATPIGAMVDLYRKLALTQKELGVSGDELIHFVDGVSVALRVAGTDATTASGSLLQLSQALGGGIVRAEEFNSILEGTPTIAQAVARGLKEAGGSVAELRKLVVDGKVSSTAFFRAFEAGSDELRRQAETSQSTIGQSFTRLGNSIVSVVGEFDKASGASANFTKMVGELGDGIDSFDAASFIEDIKQIISLFGDAEEAAAGWLRELGNSPFFGKLNEALGVTENGLVINPETEQAERKIVGLEQLVGGLQVQIENDTRMGLDVSAAVANLQRVRAELAAVRAEAANLPRLDSEFNNMTTGTLYDGANYQPPPGVGAATPAEVVSIEDHPAAPGKGKGGGGRKGKGGGGRPKEDDYQREVRAIKERTQALEIEAASLVLVAASNEDYGDALEFAKTRAELLVAAQRAGKAVTPELTAEVDALARAHVAAGMAAEEAAEKLTRIQEQSDRGKDALADMFSSVIDGSKSAKEAVADLLLEIARVQAMNAIMGLIPGGITGRIGGLLTPSFSEGGYTGPGGKYQPAGIVHAGEYVMPKAVVDRVGVGALAGLHRSALRGYQSGGLVTAGGAARKVASAAPRAAAAAPVQNISLSPQITVNASGGTPEQNADLARQMGVETEKALRGLIQRELVQQMRPGGMLR
ncbi:MAG TPA: tape measure protein [Paracoccus solventivorans]|uniref:Tape measure protein n=1 Tax=Paracoccus solventivorans TaxID=53463 RepID=A0A832PNU3_9RHOB|nr:tape measure protein [Paracoccus solventivorans]HHW34332.1 tape measure protein [Paracoccus solventivorans]